MREPARLTARRGDDVDVGIAVVVSAESDLRAAGENRGNVSSPGGELNHLAVPPCFSTTQISPA